MGDFLLFETENGETILDEYQNGSSQKDMILQEWNELLDRSENEKQVQIYMEKNPFLIPGLLDLHNGPINNVIVTQLPLGRDYVTDFSYITCNSMIWQFSFIEIESPTRKIFTKDFEFHSHFNHALQQVKDWSFWFQQNMAALVDLYEPLTEGYKPLHELKQQKCYLIYGRRSEVKQSRRTIERWSSLHKSLDNSIEVMTFDRLTDSLRNIMGDAIYHRYVTCSYKNRCFYFKEDLYKNTPPNPA